MRKSKRAINATATEMMTPPSELPSHFTIAKVVKAEGKNIWTVDCGNGNNQLVEMPPRFRSTFWLRRGAFVVVDRAAFSDRDNKLFGEIANIVGDEKAWRKCPYWCVLLLLVQGDVSLNYWCCRPCEFPKTMITTPPSSVADSHTGQSPITLDLVQDP